MSQVPIAEFGRTPTKPPVEIETLDRLWPIPGRLGRDWSKDVQHPSKSVHVWSLPRQLLDGNRLPRSFGRHWAKSAGPAGQMLARVRPSMEGVGRLRLKPGVGIPPKKAKVAPKLAKFGRTPTQVGETPPGKGSMSKKRRSLDNVA